MAKVTITEALAELKTLGKRIAKKRAFVNEYLYRQEKLKDPLEKDGGSRAAIKAERQAIADLENRIVLIRLAIAAANEREAITIEGETRTIASWLVWRREIAPGAQDFLATVQRNIHGIRQEVMKKGLSVAVNAEAQSMDDVHINLDEIALSREVEAMETRLGALDGALSLKNATILVEV